MNLGERSFGVFVRIEPDVGFAFLCDLGWVCICRVHCDDFLVIGSEECSKVSMRGFSNHACSSGLGQESLYIPRSCDMCFGNSYHACVEQFVGASLFDVP